MKLRKSEIALLAITALFLLFAAAAAFMPTRAPEATLVKTQIPAPNGEIYTSAEGGDVPEPLGLVNINTAGADTLGNLPGIGPELAGRIIQYREKHGPFEKPEDIMKVSGIGEKTFEAMDGLIICQEDTK